MTFWLPEKAKDKLTKTFGVAILSEENSIRLWKEAELGSCSVISFFVLFMGNLNSDKIYVQ